MFTPLVLVLVVLGVVVAVLALVDVARDREPGWGAVGALAVLEVGLVVQCVLGFVALADTDRDVNDLTFSAYLVGDAVGAAGRIRLGRDRTQPLGNGSRRHRWARRARARGPAQPDLGSVT